MSSSAVAAQHAAVTAEVAGAGQVVSRAGPSARALALLQIGAVAAVTAGGLALRLRGLVTPSRDIWIDEAFSIWLAKLPPWDAVVAMATVDKHPPLYALLLHLWLLPRDDPWWARLFSALCGAATIPLAALLGREVGGARVALPAAALVAASPVLVAYSQDVRMYALVVLLAFLSTLMLVRALARPLAGRWAAYGAATLLMLYTHTLTGLLLPAQACYVFGATRGRPVVRRAFAMALAAVAAGWLLWLPAVLHQTLAINDRWQVVPPTPASAAAVLADLLNGASPAALTVAGHALPYGALPLLPALPFLLVGAAGLPAGRRRRSPLFLACLAVPLGLDLLVGLWRPLFEERALLFTLCGGIMLVALGCAAPSRRSTRALLLAALLGLNLLGVATYLASAHTEDWTGPANYVATKAEPGDLVLFNASWAQLPFDYYYRRIGFAPLSEHGLPVDLFAGGQLEPPMRPADLPLLGRLTAGRPHVWLVLSHHDWTDPAEVIRPAMRALFPREEEHWFDQVLLLYYSR